MSNWWRGSENFPWFKSNERFPEYEVPVLGFIYCSCGAGKNDCTHKLNCFRDRYDIYQYFKDEKQENGRDGYWSPYPPDVWTHIITAPERRVSWHDDCKSCQIPKEYK